MRLFVLNLTFLLTASLPSTLEAKEPSKEPSKEISGEISGDLEGILQTLKLPRSALSSMVVLVTNSSDSWRQGLSGSLQAADFSLTHVGGTTEVVSRLKLTCTDKLAQNVSLEQCDVEDTCRDVAKTRRGDTLTFTMDDNAWKLTMHGNLCADAPAPMFVVPWALEHRRKNQGGFVRSFPNIAAFIMHGTYISVFDLQSKRFWHRLRFKQAAGRPAGILRQATIDSDGNVQLKISDDDYRVDLRRGAVLHLKGSDTTIRPMLTENEPKRFRQIDMLVDVQYSNVLETSQSNGLCAWRIIAQTSAEMAPVPESCTSTVGYGESPDTKAVSILSATNYRVQFLP